MTIRCAVASSTERFVNDQQWQLRGVAWLACTEGAKSDYAPAKLFGQHGSRKRTGLLSLAKRGGQGGFDNRIRQLRKLPEHKWQRLTADDFSIGDPQQVPAANSCQVRNDQSLVTQRVNFRQHFAQQVSQIDCSARGLPEQVKRLRIFDKQVGPARTQRQCRQQHRHCRRIALEERRQAQGTANRKCVPAKRFQGRIRIARLRQMLRKLPADRGQQIKRQPRVRQFQQDLLPARHVRKAPIVQIIGRQMRLIQDIDERGDFHAIERPA